MPLEAVAADVQEEEVEEELQERLDALLQRKKLLQELGLGDQLHQLLQGSAEGGGVPQDSSTQQQSERTHHTQQQTKVRSGKRFLLVVEALFEP